VQSDATTASSSTTVVADAEMKRRDRDNVLAALNQTNWQVHGAGGAAELLGIPPTTLASRIKRMGLRRSS
jgi:transcriptional regulator with GAF, ATPase, and Fis domain